MKSTIILLNIRKTWWPVLFLLATAVIVKAGDFTYTTNSDNTITITDYTGSGGAVVIPSAIDGKTVTGIGDSAFQESTNLTSITIPAGIASIGDGAFSACASLTAINVDAANAFFSSADGVLFNKSQTLLIQCPGAKTGSYAIPAGVTTDLGLTGSEGRLSLVRNPVDSFVNCGGLAKR